MARLLATFGIVAVTFIAVIVTSGSVGDPAASGVVRFSDLRRDSFTAVAAHRSYDAPSPEPLVVRVNVTGDAADDAPRAAFEWLARNVNVRVVPDPAGAPLVLTAKNLVATSGSATLGATVRTGMAVEVRHEELAACVLAHEVLHFLGLHHVAAEDNIMHARCAPGKLGWATIDAGQRAEIDRLTAITALTPDGVVTWASR